MDELQKEQIKKDLGRTFPKTKLFSVNFDGQNQLERTLSAFYRLDKEIGK
jgi:hypothetical protein